MSKLNHPVQNDISEAPFSPQFPLGATSNEAEMYQQLVHSPVGPPGDIVNRLGQQFQYPRAETPSDISTDRFHENLGTS